MTTWDAFVALAQSDRYASLFKVDNLRDVRSEVEKEVLKLLAATDQDVSKEDLKVKVLAVLKSGLNRVLAGKNYSGNKLNNEKLFHLFVSEMLGEEVKDGDIEFAMQKKESRWTPKISLDKVMGIVSSKFSREKKTDSAEWTTFITLADDYKFRTVFKIGKLKRAQEQIEALVAKKLSQGEFVKRLRGASFLQEKRGNRFIIENDDTKKILDAFTAELYKQLKIEVTESTDTTQAEPVEATDTPTEAEPEVTAATTETSAVPASGEASAAERYAITDEFKTELKAMVGAGEWDQLKARFLDTMSQASADVTTFNQLADLFRKTQLIKSSKEGAPPTGKYFITEEFKTELKAMVGAGEWDQLKARFLDTMSQASADVTTFNQLADLFRKTQLIKKSKEE